MTRNILRKSFFLIKTFKFEFSVGGLYFFLIYIYFLKEATPTYLYEEIMLTAFIIIKKSLQYHRMDKLKKE